MGRGLHSKVKEYSKLHQFDIDNSFFMYRVFTSADDFLLEVGYVPESFFKAINREWGSNSQLDIEKIINEISFTFRTVWTRFFLPHTSPEWFSAIYKQKNPIYRSFIRSLHREFQHKREKYCSDMLAMTIAYCIENRLHINAETFSAIKNRFEEPFINKKIAFVLDKLEWVKNYNNSIITSV